MRTGLHLVRQLVLVAGLTVAVAAPLAGVTAATALAACPDGEDNDTYTGSCVPYLVPNSPGGSGSLCPAGVGGTECGSAEVQATPTAPVAPTGPEQELEDVSTPDF
ncbi:hypothetical protein [Mycolicibacterium neworleansense]|uniref:Intersectin-EH binding protein Ibp1 n=1 Tax=Mycolicibacterium neworleansense TaxID=146018 RepID=A0A0H5RWV0_9MYCO|nr:hypothetical protein [Mycolicibacterium neworleansense]MCV7361244.1 hypothetical protein [Mycolicibacterium neworleansense]CRZ18393.1 intersectin-EH binding protein Ibp1 [Mycolicibacterium neworleansense]